MVASILCSIAPRPAVGDTLSLCGNPGPAPAVQHVIVVMLENESYNQVVGSPNAPYQTSLASQCGVAPDYFGATHNSAANYMAISAGEYPASSSRGCGTVSGCADSSDNLYNQLTRAGLTWGGFMEAMPSNCDGANYSTDGHIVYKIGHNPILFYQDIPASACLANDIAVSDLAAESGAFWNDLQNQTLPSFSWVTPDEADDDEGAGNPAHNEQAADAWLQEFLSAVSQSNSYQAGNTLVLVSYDEGSNYPDRVTNENCANEGLDLPVTNGVSAHQESCHVPLFVIYPYTPGGDSDPTFFDHYSITKTVEDLFGLPYLAHAADAETSTLVGHFGIPGSTSPAPSVGVTSPPDNGTVSGTVTISGTAQAQDGASIAQVQVGVDNGPLQPATGTTSWTADLDTTALANGAHTISARATDTNGDTATATITVDVSNGSATACPASAAELSGNVSLENSQSGWTGKYDSKSVLARVEPAGGSYDGMWALQVRLQPGTSGMAGVTNAKPVWVPGSPGPATTAGQVYTGSAFVEASTAGEKVSLRVWETAPAGTVIGSHTTTVTLRNTTWRQIASAYTAEGTGDALRYSLHAANLADSSQDFLADCLSLQTP